MGLRSRKLVSRYHQKVFMVILGDAHREDALEVAQELFLGQFRKIKSFKAARHFNWIYRIAVNNAIDANASRNAIR